MYERASAFNLRTGIKWPEETTFSYALSFENQPDQLQTDFLRAQKHMVWYRQSLLLLQIGQLEDPP